MRGLWRYKFRRTTSQLVLFVGVLAGLGLARLETGFSGWLCMAGLPIVLLALRRRSFISLAVVLLFGVSCGLWRGGIYMHRLSAYESLQYQRITLTARANEDGIYDGKAHQLSFTADHVVLENGQRLAGKIQMGGFGVNAIFQGDEVRAEGKLYPGRGAYQGKMSFAKLQVVSHHASLVDDIRRRFTAGIRTALPEPLASFAMGLLIGQRNTLPDGIKQDLLMVGLTHIIAVSGYNLTIILRASRGLLAKRSKRLSTGLSFGLIGVFLLLAGASASIVRAAIVSMLSIYASYYGRSFKPLNLLALTAAVTTWFNPVYLWSDLSWYLSFLAFYGVMVLAPLIRKRWPSRWHKTLLGSVAQESVCAEIMGLPFVLHIFGQMSLIGLPANLLIATMVPLAMLLSTIAGLAGMLTPALVGWLSWPAVALLNYMLDLAHLMAGIPHVFIENKTSRLMLCWLVTLSSCLLPPPSNTRRQSEH